MTASSVTPELPISALLDDNVSFPFSVTGGLRRRLERQQVLFGTVPSVERFDYQELRGTGSAKHRVVRPTVLTAPEPQPKRELEPTREPIALAPQTFTPPTFRPTPSIVPPALPEEPTFQATRPEPEPVDEAPIQPLLAMPTVEPPKPEPFRLPSVEPVKTESFHIKDTSAPKRTWNVVDMSSKATVPSTTHSIEIETGWGVREQETKQFATWTTVKQAPTKLSETFDIDLEGHKAEVSKAEAHAMENLPTSNIRAILMNAAVCAVLITALFGILTALSHR